MDIDPAADLGKKTKRYQPAFEKNYGRKFEEDDEVAPTRKKSKKIAKELSDEDYEEAPTRKHSKKATKDFTDEDLTLKKSKKYHKKSHIHEELNSDDDELPITKGHYIDHDP